MRSFDGKRASYLRDLVPTVLAGAIVLLAPVPATAHFMITAPATPPQPATVQSWMSEDSVGGPQKNGPCAATPNTSLGDSAGTPTNAITVIQPGQKVTIPITITVGHPGWFRVSLHQGPSSGQTLTTLPDPVAQSGTSCTPAMISNPVWSPTQPVLADDLPAGSTASTQQTGTKSFQVTIPSNASCSSAQPCTLQVVMIMTDHPATDCYYHHCADIAIASAAGTGGTSGSGGATGAGGRGAGGNGAAGNGSGGSSSSGGSPGAGGTATGADPGTGGIIATGGSGAEATGGAAGSNGSSGTGGMNGTGGQSGGATTETGGSTGGGPGASGSSGCSCTLAGHEPASIVFGAAAAVALMIARRRRRGTGAPS